MKGITEDVGKNLSGAKVAKNVIYNLIGYGAPLIVAVIVLPQLIKGLGEERFGILNLAWIVIGYFSLFDFGIGRALTKIIAEKLGENKTKEIPSIFWTSLFLMFVASLLGAVFFIFLTPTIVQNFLNISPKYLSESTDTFYLLAISIPIVTTTTGLRGLLEAYHKFGIINVIRIILGIFSFLGPLICLVFTANLFWITLVLIVLRIIIWILYLLQCFRLNVSIKKEINIKSDLIKPIFKLSGWITVSNIIVPLIIYMDRFLIGSLISAAAITYYATPYEVVTKLLLIPGAVVAVLFPAFSASYSGNPDYTKTLSIKAVKYIFIILYPLMLFIVVFAKEGMNIWLGEKFVENSALILQMLSIGVLFNSLAYIPFSFLQGIGKPDITAKLNLLELPFYLFAMWFAIKKAGINGAALIWLIRMFVVQL